MAPTKVMKAGNAVKAITKTGIAEISAVILASPRVSSSLPKAAARLRLNLNFACRHTSMPCNDSPKNLPRIPTSGASVPKGQGLVDEARPEQDYLTQPV